MEDKDLTLRKILFLPAQGRLITLAAPENILHFWEIDDNKIEKVNYFEIKFEIKLKLYENKLGLSCAKLRRSWG